MVKILVIGDIVGRPGRKLVGELLPALTVEHQLDLVVANGENAAGGAGITPAICKELFQLGIDVITSGNHIWDKKEIIAYIQQEKRLIRPANYPEGTPGRGWAVVTIGKGVSVAVANFAGRVFMEPLDCPFQKAMDLLPSLRQQAEVILIDFHGEATSEKQAFAWFLDGHVSAVFGTHTHVQTADEGILPKGTGYITDIGMTGPGESILGIEKEIVVEKFTTQLPQRFQVAKGPGFLNGIILDIDETTGKCRELRRVFEAE